MPGERTQGERPKGRNSRSVSLSKKIARFLMETEPKEAFASFQSGIPALSSAWNPMLSGCGRF